MQTLTHFDTQGQAHMVDVGGKPATHRIAVAQGCIRMQENTWRMVSGGSHRKGDVLGVARLAGIMACKRTADLVPLCHPVALTHVALDWALDAAHFTITCTVKAETVASTGVEMEALTGVQIALLTIYDMCKAVDRGMTMDAIRLVEKSGGKSGHYLFPTV